MPGSFSEVLRMFQSRGNPTKQGAFPTRSLPRFKTKVDSRFILQTGFYHKPKFF